MDRVCTLLTQCELGVTYERIAPLQATSVLADFVVYTQDRVCAAISGCEFPVTFVAQPATLTSDTMCQAVSVCEDTQAELADPTPSSDRQVSGCRDDRRAKGGTGNGCPREARCPQ